MLNSRLTHRIIWTLNCVVLWLILDKLFASPLWAFAASLIALTIGMWRLNNQRLLVGRFKLDDETAATLRTVILALIFFAGCAVEAFLIL